MIISGVSRILSICAISCSLIDSGIIKKPGASAIVLGGTSSNFFNAPSIDSSSNPPGSASKMGALSDFADRFHDLIKQEGFESRKPDQKASMGQIMPLTVGHQFGEVHSPVKIGASIVVDEGADGQRNHHGTRLDAESDE